MDGLSIFEISLNMVVLIAVIISTIWNVKTGDISLQTKTANIITVWTIYLLNLAFTVFLLQS